VILVRTCNNGYCLRMDPARVLRRLLWYSYVECQHCGRRWWSEPTYDDCEPHIQFQGQWIPKVLFHDMRELQI
jgi:hypothetical protein